MWRLAAQDGRLSEREAFLLSCVSRPPNAHLDTTRRSAYSLIGEQRMRTYYVYILTNRPC